MRDATRTHSLTTGPLARRLLALCLLALSASPSAAQPDAPGPAQEPPTGKTISAVDVEGNHAIPADRVRGQMLSRPGTKYNQATILEDHKRVRDMRAFHDVNIYFQVLADDTVRVIVAVAELQGVVHDVIYEGAKHLKKDELETLTGVRVGTPLSPQVNQTGVHTITRRYYDQGRIFASVQLVEGGNYNDKRVVYRITEGPEVKVGSVKAVGCSFVPEQVLRTHTSTSRAMLGMGGTFQPVMVEFDVEKIRDYYRTNGFQDVTVQREFKLSPDNRWVDVVFHVHEGPRYRVSKVQIDGNKEYSEEQVLSVTTLRDGQTYDGGVVRADVARIKDYYGNRGRAVEVREDRHQTGPGEIAVRYQVLERPPARVGDVKIIGNTVTRDNVIRRQIGLLPGQILTYPDLRASEANLARLGIFKTEPEGGVRPTVTVLDPDGPSEVKDILVQVEEAPTGSFLIGLGVNSDAGLSGSIVLNERNFDITRVPLSFEELLSGRAFRGAGQELRLEAVPGTQFQRYTASFREPSLFDSPWAFSASGYYYTRAFNEYTEGRAGGRIGLDRRISDLWKLTSSLRIENVKTSGVSIFAPAELQQNQGDHFLLGGRVGVSRDSRDSYLRPTEGSLLDLSYEQVTGDYDFPIGTAEFSKFWTTYSRADGSGKHVLSFKSQLGVAGSQTPFFERFYAGGFRSLRGFQFRGVGPFEPGVVGTGAYNVGGRLSFLNSLEYQIPLNASEGLYFVSFLDTGTVERNIEIKDYRVTVGAGLRIQLPMLGPVPIALDFGIPVVKGPEDRKQIFSFWMGFFN